MLDASVPEPPVIRKLRQLRNERYLVVRTRTAFLNQIKTVSDQCALRRISKMIETLTDQIKAVEKEILREIDSDSKIKQTYTLLISIPGVGLINAVTTIVATGNFTRFQTARQYAKFCCVSPLSKQSGTSVRSGDHVSHAGHNEIKTVLTEAARSAVQHDWQLREYYTRKRGEGKTHGCVMNAVKFKIICRMFAVVKRQTAYVNTMQFRS